MRFLVLTSFFRKRAIGEESLGLSPQSRARARVCVCASSIFLAFHVFDGCQCVLDSWDRGKEKGEKYIYIETWYEVCGYMRFIDYNTYVFLDRLFTTNLLVSALY